MQLLKVYVSLIETRDAGTYGGDRVCVFWTRGEAEQDMLDFLNDERDDETAEYETADDAMEDYGRRCQIEECSLEPEPSKAA